MVEFEHPRVADRAVDARVTLEVLPQALRQAFPSVAKNSNVAFDIGKTIEPIVRAPGSAHANCDAVRRR